MRRWWAGAGCKAGERVMTSQVAFARRVRVRQTGGRCRWRRQVFAVCLVFPISLVKKIKPFLKGILIVEDFYPVVWRS